MSENNNNTSSEKQVSARDIEICRLYIGTKDQPGLTLQALGEQFHISRERVRQILRREGVFKRDRHIDLHNQYLGVGVPQPLKDALYSEAEQRGISVSALVSETLEAHDHKKEI